MGLPVVCRADPAVAGLIIQGETGYACDGVAGMAVAARRLLTDGALRAKIVAAARRKADAYSADAFVAASERLYLRTTPKEKPCIGENIRRQRRTI